MCRCPVACPRGSTVALAKRRSAMVWQGTVKNCVGVNMALYQRQLKGQLKKGSVHVIFRSRGMGPTPLYPFPLKNPPRTQLCEF